MNTRGRWRKVDTAVGAVHRPTAERSDLASRSARPPDLGAAYSETGSCGSEEGRAQQCADLFHIVVRPWSEGGSTSRPAQMLSGKSLWRVSGGTIPGDMLHDSACR
jgi:hypothetical protein